ncbi:MAG: PIN domain-containing protein [Candidatus Omnitrophica bacterium]|nr:PIN domain-containing protein [Candidatus Omnitrophota bacterium]MBI3021467.1 PIN domain-containing protein [Candidatus Omnitrophota bacterium]MBI3083649.1 PIN domain-containing protein [Candidatus Omnitrophota bacterium]
MILFDANILVYAHAKDSPFHEIARHLRDQAVQGVIQACVSPQVLCEFFSVITDDRLAKHALTPAEAAKELETYWHASQFRKILPGETTMARLLRLLEQFPLKRGKIFDAFLVATMLDNGVRTIYTQNVKDFERYQELQVINPLTVAARPPS